MKTTENRHEMDLTRGPILKTLISLSLPIMLSNFMQTLYNLTDMFWLGKLGESARDAVAVVGMTFPLIFFFSSFGIGFAVAGTALIARFKGGDEVPRIRRVVAHLVWIVGFFSLLFILMGTFFLEDILKVLSTPPEIMGLARQYISVILMGLPFMYLVVFFQSIAHGLGDTIHPMKVQIISVMINVVIDPLFIFGWGFFPAGGTLGAAYATFLARFVGAFMALFYMVRVHRRHLPGKHEMLPEKRLMGQILKISIPASLAQSMTSFGFLFLQGFVNSFGTVVISIHSIGNRMTGFFMMPAMGISNALTAMVGQNLGAGNTRRAIKSFHRATVLVMGIMGAGALIIFNFGAYLTRFFIDDPAVVDIGVRMFKITSVASFIFGAVFMFIGLFNGAGKTGAVFLFNVSRLWLFRIPFVYLLSGRISGPETGWMAALLDFLARPLASHPYDALWWSMIISNFLAALWAFILYKKGSWKHVRF
ncbi:MAG TPA: MATE family efflux transporter [Candidatus Mcinerneyibacteriales bacterium]|nr:MATE family efflux transporter [Candidatus Mcinerneyibacteriales bacterium]